MVNSTTVQVFGQKLGRLQDFLPTFFINAILNFGQECNLHSKNEVSARARNSTYLTTMCITYLHTYNVLTYLADAGSPAAVVAMASASASTGNSGVVPIANVSGLLGRSARLPCDTTPPSPDNPLLLVIWFKEPSPDPIYRYLWDLIGFVHFFP